jgi:hypothetical protein
VSEEEAAEEAKLFGVVGDIEEVVGTVCAGIEEVVVGEEGAERGGAALGGVDERGCRAELLLDLPEEKGKVGAAEDEGVDGMILERTEIFLECERGDRMVNVPLFNEMNEKGTRDSADVRLGEEVLQVGLVGA